MKVLTILGTRPEIIRLSRIIPKLDEACDHVLVHTGQNYDPNLSDVFFQELGLREPDVTLECGGGWFPTQASRIISDVAHVLDERKPDRVLILGDTNSALAAIVAKRMGIPVYHMEAGNRCYDDRVPEEVNRRIVDHCSDVLMPYTERSRANLLREGFAGQQVYVVGNPMREVILHYRPQIDVPNIEVPTEPGRYFLATVHRSENVDNERRLRAIMDAFARLATEYRFPVVCSLHPHTRQRLEDFAIETPGVSLIEPLGFFGFVALQRRALCVLSDSGTVPEECCILGVPSVSLRDVTERPEMFECGGSILAGVEPEGVRRAVRLAVEGQGAWAPPPEYMRTNVSDTVVKILLGQ